MNDAEYKVEYHRFLNQLDEQFAIGESAWEQVLQAMWAVDHEMNGNGGCNWAGSVTTYEFYLDILKEHLTNEKQFSAEQLAKIKWSLDEIRACGLELKKLGESFLNATEAVDYLILRVVDWCYMHPRQKGED